MYKLLLKIAYKNSFLRLSRTLLVILMISLSMGMMLGIQGLYDGMAENMIDKNKRSDGGDISIYAKEYRIQKDLQHSILDATTIQKELLQIDTIEAVVRRLKADGLASTARKSSFSSIIGINLQDEEKFGKFSEFLKSGTIQLDKRYCIIGIELAKTLKVKVGSKIIFSTQDSLGEINSLALKVKAVVQTTNISLDTNAIFIDNQKLHTFLNIPSTTATQIAIRTKSEKIYEMLTKKYPNLDVKTFLELQPMMKQMQDIMLIFNSITFFIVMGVVFIGILGVMYVSILDRIREFGIVLSLGMHYKYIRTQIILEALFVSLSGYIAGAILGYVILYYLCTYGLDLSEFSDSLEMWGYESVIYATIKISYFTNTFFAIIFAAFLSVILPLRKIKKLSPIDVIKADI